MALTPGTKLGPYEIQSTLGAGGMGEVYCAKDTRLDRTVAIKILPSHLSSDPELKQRMEREAKAISAMQHANICTLYDIGTQDGANFLVMEYLEGQTLAERLVKGELPLDQVLKIGTEIALALEKAHQQGIIHRDLKPANIMLTKAGGRTAGLLPEDPQLCPHHPNPNRTSGNGLSRPPTLSVRSQTHTRSNCFTSIAAPRNSARMELRYQATIVNLFLRDSLVGRVGFPNRRHRLKRDNKLFRMKHSRGGIIRPYVYLVNQSPIASSNLSNSAGP
jgi:hypothetical protein